MVAKIPLKVEITSENKCGFCTNSKCCTYITQKIPGPRSRDDFDHLLWQLSHENVQAYKDGDGWFLLVNNRCRHLQTDGRCGIYATRPAICREYPPFPAVRANDPEYAVTGCERYDPEPEPSFIFVDPDVLARCLKKWFDYDPARDAVRYVLDRSSVKIKRSAS